MYYKSLNEKILVFILKWIGRAIESRFAVVIQPRQLGFKAF